MPEDLVIGEPQIFEDPEFTNGEASLSEAEVTHFREQGFLVKRGLLDEGETFERIVDYVWENVPRGLFQRDDPNTWFDATGDKWTDEDA